MALSTTQDKSVMMGMLNRSMGVQRVAPKSILAAMATRKLGRTVMMETWKMVTVATQSA